MLDFGGQPQGRTAMLLILLALMLTVATAAYLVFTKGGADEADTLAVDQPERPIDARPARQLFYKLSILLVSLLLILIFVIGSYLLIRIGRAVTGKPIGGKATEYVDAWGSYRLSQEEIDTATDGLEHDFPPDAPPGEQES